MQIHYWEVSPRAMAVSDFESTFYETIQSGLDSALYDNLWYLSRVEALPRFGIVEDDEVHHWLGMVGGQLPDVDHPA